MGKCTFSIVIPVFNREREIAKALRSCLGQSFRDFEVLVVDDASTDNSVGAVQEFLCDARVTLTRIKSNLGEWGARSAGVQLARGEWIVFLDSDWEFLPDGLDSMREAVEKNQGEFDRFGFEAIYDDGSRCPLPAISSPVILDLPGYLRWFPTTTRSDAVWCAKRETFSRVPLPSGRSGHQLYACAFNATYRTVLLPGAVCVMHTDGDNCLTTAGARYDSNSRLAAQAQLAQCEDLLRIYGDAMLQFSPLAHQRVSRTLVVSSLMAGSRSLAVSNWLRYIRHHRSVESVALAALIGLGRRGATFIRRHRLQRLARRRAMR